MVIDTRRPREPVFPTVRIPIPAAQKMEYASSNSSGINKSNSLPDRSKKQLSKLEYDDFMRRHYSNQPLEEQRAISSPMYSPTRSYDVSERRDAVESLPSSYQHDEVTNQHYTTYTPQLRDGKHHHSKLQHHQRVSIIPRPHDYRASSPAPPQVSYQPQNGSNQQQIKVKSSRSRAVGVINRKAEIESHSQQHQHQDGYSDDGSKKSKKSLISRASRKLKKKIAKEQNNHTFPVEEVRNDEGSQYTRDARDPSPTIGIKSRYHNNNVVKEIALPEGDWVYSGRSPNGTDYQGLIQAFPSLGEFSSGSTISTAFTNHLGDVVVSSGSEQDRIKHLHRSDQHAVDDNEKVQKQSDEMTLPTNHRSSSTSFSSSTSKTSSVKPSFRIGTTSSESKQHEEQARHNAQLESEVDDLRNQLARQERVTEIETKKLIEELRKQKQQFQAMQGNANNKINQYKSQGERDLEAYKGECFVYRERLVQMEKDNAKMEQAVYNERKKVLSLEAENEMLIKAAEEKVGNVMTLEKAKSSELRSYMEQCEMYRQRVLDLERKVMSMESALSSTTSIATALEEEKNTMSSELSQAEANVATLKSETSDKDVKIGSLQSEIANLQSASSNLEAALKNAESKANDDNQSIATLENENSSILDQLKEKSMLVEKLQISSAKYKEIEDENASLRRKNDELAAKEMQLKEELSKSEVFSSNTERLRKMLSDSESYISSLQDDLSLARTTHHQQLTDARAKYSSEINCLTTKWEGEKAAKRELETKNNNLEDVISSLEIKISEIEDKGTHQTKAQSEQLLKMMGHADDLRKKLSECSEEMSVMRNELDSNEQTTAQLRHEIRTLEDEKTAMADNVHALEVELHDFTTEKTKQIKELQQCIKDRDEAVVKQENSSLAASAEKLQQIKDLNATLVDLKKELEAADEENNLLRKQLSNAKEVLRKQSSDMKQHISKTMNDLRVEQTTIKLDVQSSLHAEKAFLEKKVKELTLDCKRKLESDQLNKEMVHQASMSSLHSQMKATENLLIDERKKSQQLESKLEEVRSKKEAAELTIKAACSKLGHEIREIDLADAIDDLTLDRTQAESTIITLNIDIKALKASMGTLEYAKDQLTEQMRLLSERKEKEINELKRAFDSDRKAQDASIDSLIASKEEELYSISTTNEELKGQIKKLTEEACQLQKLSDHCEAELKGCEEKLSAAKEESSRLDKKLREATHSYQEKADNLTEHYMKIEDDLRIQLLSTRQEQMEAEKRIEDLLNAARQEKDTVEKKLAADKKETDRLMDELNSEKKELTSRVMELTDHLDILSNERDTLQREEEVLKSTIALKEKEAEELQEFADSTKDKLQKDLDSLKNELFEQKSSYECELERMLLSLETCKENVEVLTFENNSLEESVASLSSRISQAEKAKSKQADEIVQLKMSLNEALEEALRLGSKIDEEKLRHLEITQTLSMFKEENNDLTQSLTGVEEDKSSFNERIVNLSAEKNILQKELSDKDKQLHEALKTLTHYELKLAKIEQDRDRREQLSENALKEVERLQKATASLESENEELIGQISILQLDSNADTLYKELLDKMKAKDIEHEEEFYEMSATVDSLKAQLAAVTQEKHDLEVVNNEKTSALQNSLESIKQQLLKKQRCSDDISTVSSKTSKSHLKQTVVELEESVDAIRNHYENKIRSLQQALDGGRKKIEKYERKISDLTTLLEENAAVLLKIQSNYNRPQAQRKRSSVRSSKSEDSEESEVSY